MISGSPSATLSSILYTEELHQRPLRLPDHEMENRALATLVQALANSPQTILQVLADTILKVIRAESAGLSLLTKDGNRFYWPAISGQWQPHLGGGTPRESGPCGDVLDCNVPLLFKRWERRYAYLEAATPLAEEGLLVPFYVNGKAVGTIWAITHDPARKFDLEDLRILESLGRFASAAYQIFTSRELIKEGEAASHLLEEAVQSRHAVEALNLELRTSELRYRTLFDLGPVAVFSCKASGAIEDFNRRTVELLGLAPAQEDIAEKFRGSFKLYRPDGVFIPLDQAPMAEVLSGKIPEVRDAEVLVERSDGSRLTVIANIRALKNHQGEIVGAINCFYDISDRKQAENELRRTSSLLNSIMTSSSDVIYVKDRGSRMVYCNPTGLSLIGAVEPEVYGKTDVEFLGPGCGGEEILRTDERIMSSGVGETAEEWVNWPDGTKRLYMSQKVPRRDPGDKVTGLIGVSRDITTLKQTQTELEKAVRTRDEFLSIASHELKTPLTSLTILNQLRKRQLSKGQTSSFTLENLGSLFDSDLQYLAKINRLIEDMLDISRIRTGALELKKECVDLSRLVRETVEGLRPQFNEAQVDIEIETCGTALIYADSFRFEQVITNLLQNAIKYGRGKPIQVKVNLGGGMASLRVIDQGIGIDGVNHERVFLPFERAISANEVSGLGLGLAIVKSVIKAHNGQISLESEFGKGSTFTVEIPLTDEGPGA